MADGADIARQAFRQTVEGMGSGSSGGRAVWSGFKKGATRALHAWRIKLPMTLS
jgi:hypothetical protein